MKKLAQEILDGLEAISYDDMDNFDKYDYFEDNIKCETYDLCNKVLDDSPLYIEADNNKDLKEIEDRIMQEYHNSDASMWDVLASIGVNNISLEQAIKLYASLMKYSDGDVIVRFTNEISKEDLDKVGDYTEL